MAVLGGCCEEGAPPLLCQTNTACSPRAVPCRQPSTPCTTSARCPSPSTSWTVSHRSSCLSPPLLPPPCVTPSLHHGLNPALRPGDASVGSCCSLGTPSARAPPGGGGTPLIPSLLPPPDLSKHRRYEIRMSVYNAVGEGPPSPPQEVFVGEAGESDILGCSNALVPRPPQCHHETAPWPPSPLHTPEVPVHPPHLGGGVSPPPWPQPGGDAVPSLGAVPTGAPQNVVVKAATATQLDVTWEPPPPESQNGDIQGYKVPSPGHRAAGTELGALGRCWGPWKGAGCHGGVLGSLGRCCVGAVGGSPGRHWVYWEVLGAPVDVRRATEKGRGAQRGTRGRRRPSDALGAGLWLRAAALGAPSADLGGPPCARSAQHHEISELGGTPRDHRLQIHVPKGAPKKISASVSCGQGARPGSSPAWNQPRGEAAAFPPAHPEPPGV